MRRIPLILAGLVSASVLLAGCSVGGADLPGTAQPAPVESTMATGPRTTPAVTTSPPVSTVRATTSTASAPPTTSQGPTASAPDVDVRDTLAVVPLPVSATAPKDAAPFTLGSSSRIITDQSAAPVAALLADYLRPTGLTLPEADGPPQPGDIVIRRAEVPALAPNSAEGYRLSVTADAVTIEAPTPHGLFNAIQTLRQLLPATATLPQTIPAVTIVDYPRFSYRGLMIDIARHYRTPAEVEALIDEAAAYKINTIHLHLADDQGFRLQIDGFPRLTSVGGRGAVGTDGREMDAGGYWTRADYRAVVAYASARYMTLIPEVETPGHSNAIIMSEYDDTENPLLSGDPADINCGISRPPRWNYSMHVGYSALCPESANTWTIVSAIVTQLAKDTPGPYLNIGGDEVPREVLAHDRYASAVTRAAQIVADTGKSPMGWAEIAEPGTALPPGSVAQYWNPARGSGPGTETATDAVAKGAAIVMSPANHTYLDQIYAPGVPSDIGITWACPAGCDIDQFYGWDPATYVDGVGEADILGVEGTLFGETIRTVTDAERLIFPRLTALAEIGWSPPADRTSGGHAADDFLRRVATQGARWTAAGIAFHRTALVPWP